MLPLKRFARHIIVRLLFPDPASPSSLAIPNTPHAGMGDPHLVESGPFLPRPIHSLNVVDLAVLLDNHLTVLEQELSFSSNDVCGQEPSCMEKDIELYFSIAIKFHPQ